MDSRMARRRDGVKSEGDSSSMSMDSRLKSVFNVLRREVEE